MRTLYWYFGREMLKTFLMTSAALSMLIIMGGGLSNIFTEEGIGAGQLAKVFVYLGPVAVTLVLPVAGLFSATITYGRAALDNEVLACRAAGINIQRLLVPPLVLGVLITGVTYFSWNYAIPYLTASIYEVTRQDLPAIVLGQFRKAKPLVFRDYRILAEQCAAIGPKDLPKEVPADFLDHHTLLQLSAVSFLELDDQELMRYGTADKTVIDFDQTGRIPRITVDMQGVRSFDAQRRQYHKFKHQVLGPIEIPLPIKRKTKFETLGRLLGFLDAPETIPEIRDLLHGMRREMKAFFLNQYVEDRMRKQPPVFTLASKKHTIEVSAGGFVTDPVDGRTRLRDVRARLIPTPRFPGPTEVYLADEASVELRSGTSPGKPYILVELLGNVRISREPAAPDDRVVKKPRETLTKVYFKNQKPILAMYEAFDITRLFEPDPGISLYEKQERMRRRLAEKMRSNVAEVRGEIHFRASYSLCAVAIVVLGALLGIIVRGGQVLTAFGISCVPMLIVIVASIVGRNLVDRPGYATASLSVMWGAAVFMYASAWFVAARILKR